MRGCRGEEETVDKGEEELLTTDGGQTVIDLAMHAPQRMLRRWRWRAQDFATGRGRAQRLDHAFPHPSLPSPPLPSPPLPSPPYPLSNPSPAPAAAPLLPSVRLTLCCAAISERTAPPERHSFRCRPSGGGGGGGGIETPLNLHWVCFRVGG